MQTKLKELLALIDDANSADPVHEKGAHGPEPRALLYGRRMSECLESLHPEACVELRIAAHAQHICRWQIPRDDYPAGRNGYLKWRRDLAGHHARLCAELMARVEMDETSIERVQYLLLKKGLKRDKDTQALEDVACLVFLKHHLADFATKHDDEKIISVIAKTWHKMSPQGHEHALALEYTAQQRCLIEAALGEP